MSNILEYIVNVRDQASAVMSKLGQGAEDVAFRMKGMQSETVIASSALRQMGIPINSLKGHLERLKKERGWLPESKIATIKEYNREISALEKQINKLETTTGSKTGQWFKEAFQSIPFAGLLTNPLVVAGAIGGRSISLGIQKDLDKSAFNLHLKSEDAAQQMMDDLGKIKMDKAALNLGAKLLLDNKIDGSEILPVMDAIANIAGGAKDKVGSLSLAFAQMSSVGQLNGQDLNQMINAGYNPLVEMSEKSGKSIAQLKDEMSKGGISVQMVKDSFIEATSEGGRFYNYLNMQAETIGGKWGLMMANVNEKLVHFYDLISPVINKLLDLSGAVLDVTFNGLGWMVDKLKEGHPVALAIAVAIGLVTTSLIIMKAASLSVAAVSGLLTIATNMSTAAWWANNAAMLANPVTWIIAGVIALISLLGYLIYKIDGWGEAWAHTVEAAKSVWSGVVNTFKAYWGSFYHLLMSGIELIMLAWYKLKAAWGDEQATQEISIIEKRSEERKKALKEASISAVRDFSNAWESTKKATGSLSWNDKSLSDFTKDLKGTLGISSPTLPGTATVNSNIGGNTNSSTSATAVATGGTKHNYITINLDKLIEVLNITGKDFKESSSNMADATQDALLRVLAMASTAGN